MDCCIPASAWSYIPLSFSPSPFSVSAETVRLITAEPHLEMAFSQSICLHASYLIAQNACDRAKKDKYNRAQQVWTEQVKRSSCLSGEVFGWTWAGSGQRREQLTVSHLHAPGVFQSFGCNLFKNKNVSVVTQPLVVDSLIKTNDSNSCVI